MFFKSKSKPEHQENWINYHTCINDEVFFVLTDVGLRSIAPVKHYDYLASFRLFFIDPTKEGLYKNEEYEIIVKIENQITSLLQDKYKSICLGCITGNGRKEYCYYIANPQKLNDSIDKVMKQFPDYRYETKIKIDKQWDQYFKILYPTPEEYQVFNDSLVIHNLISSGDDLSQERLVTHWSYFPTEALRTQFIEEVIKQGFEIQENGLTFQEEHEHPYGVIYERVDQIGTYLIHDLTLPLFRLSQEYQGEYDGWETFVVKTESGKKP